MTINRGVYVGEGGEEGRGGRKWLSTGMCMGGGGGGEEGRWGEKMTINRDVYVGEGVRRGGVGRNDYQNCGCSYKGKTGV